MTIQEETRLAAATFCGTLRDSHEMTLVRLNDVRAVIGSLLYYRDHASMLDAQGEEIKRERDDLKRELAELRKGVSSAISTLENAACAVR